MMALQNYCNNSFNEISFFLSNFDILYTNKMNCYLINALFHNFKINKIVNHMTRKNLEKCLLHNL